MDEYLYDTEFEWKDGNLIRGKVIPLRVVERYPERGVVVTHGPRGKSQASEGMYYRSKEEAEAYINKAVAHWQNQLGTFRTNVSRALRDAGFPEEQVQYVAYLIKGAWTPND